MAEHLNLDPILAQVAAQLAVEPGTLQVEAIATGKHNSSFWVSSAGKRWVLRVAPPDSIGLLFYERHMMRQEPDLHRLIRLHTAIPVAEIVLADFSREYVDRDYLLMTVLPGVPLSEASFLNVQQRNQVLMQVGHHLRQLHALAALDCLGMSGYGYIGLHHPMAPQSTWVGAFRTMWALLLQDVVASGCYTDRDRQFMTNVLDQHISYFENAAPPCLLHMDIWSQNILVDSAGNVTGLVDFDRALWGDPEIEFAVLDYCGISEPTFWQGYGCDRNQSPAAQVRQRFYLLYEIQKYMPIAIWRRHDPQRALSFKENSLALAHNLLSNPVEKV